ncbi:16S rRNA (cytosine(1402)-N(4))-methyltransferase RsmH [Candidatus Erwinia haradaeae]|uniref:Ribosomal RNA small subunit methyltransferase H n=1 Tax=Candidatus Erwinia haradaeae TaxID=1922217 RepID=A0A451DL56_9GAMM|nr:16S rRNA (cytosine(1402)-N(4))-methyltransferase RsmH [Candidatus Erwinia haradaeae]VFP87464.1 Ribosomal RNA small subunit methyltransferase H [Candidatus Erwinia haradaeae]
MQTILKHIPVLVNEAVNGLNIKSNGIYIDGTFGCGGHSRVILSHLGTEGRLYAMDCDPCAISIASEITDPRFTAVHSSFSEMAQYVSTHQLKGKIDGIMLDFGVSSPQIDDAQRGFSFMKDGPLDMRMDPSRGQSAATWLLSTKEKDIAFVLRAFGQERFAKRIARAIAKRNHKNPITRTKDLADVIYTAIPFREKWKHPATRSFQAIRMVINNEIEEIKEVLSGTLQILKSGGRLSVITFHSLEDRLVKNFIRENSNRRQVPFGFPISEAQLDHLDGRRLKSLHKMMPNITEICNNPRARSATLRIAERI